MVQWKAGAGAEAVLMAAGVAGAPDSTEEARMPSVVVTWVVVDRPRWRNAVRKTTHLV